MGKGETSLSGKLQGQVAIVTGGSRGIGRGICGELASAGATVIVNYTSHEEAALEVVAEIKQRGGQAEAIGADIGVKAEIDRMVSDVKSRYGRIDILVNNAGICPFRDFFAIEEETWNRTIAVNLAGAFFCSQAAGAVMREQGSGAIVHISTVTTMRGGPEQVHYAASKGGMNALTSSMANALGKYGIRVNAILCGGVATDINLEQRKQAGAVVDEWASNLPARRGGRPSDLGKAIVYLTSPDAEWVTGALLAVDGGALIM